MSLFYFLLAAATSLISNFCSSYDRLYHIYNVAGDGAPESTCGLHGNACNLDRAYHAEDTEPFRKMGSIFSPLCLSLSLSLRNLDLGPIIQI